MKMKNILTSSHRNSQLAPLQPPGSSGNPKKIAATFASRFVQKVEMPKRKQLAEAIKNFIERLEMLLGEILGNNGRIIRRNLIN
jgi:hypothetical protein